MLVVKKNHWLSGSTGNFEKVACLSERCTETVRRYLTIRLNGKGCEKKRKWIYQYNMMANMS